MRRNLEVDNDVKPLINRLPRKLKMDFKIDNTANEIQSQKMTFSTIAIWIFHDLKNFDFCIEIFDENTFTRNATIILLFFNGQAPTFRLLFGSFTIMMKCGNSLITTVSLLLNAIKYATADSVFIQRIIMCLSAALSSA